MKILNRAKHLYSDKYFISDSVDFRFNQMYLKVDGVWLECDEATRSIHLSDMTDSEGTKIFASLSEDGKGGSTIKCDVRLHHLENINCFVQYAVNNFFARDKEDKMHYYNGISNIKVTGIQD